MNDVLYENIFTTDLITMKVKCLDCSYPECCHTRESITTRQGNSLSKVSGENAT